MPTRGQIENALRKAHAAGNVEDAHILANALKSLSDPFEGADTSPLPDDPQYARVQKRLDQGIPLGPNPHTEASQQSQRRREAGISTDVPASVKLKLSLTKKDKASVKSVLDSHYGEDIAIEYDSFNGNYQYLNPDTNRITSIKGDMLTSVGGAIPVTTETVGTVAGGAGGLAATKHPAGMVAGESIGAGAGGYIGEFIRLGLGSMVGNDISLEEIHESALHHAKIAGGVTAATGGVVHLAKPLANFVQGRQYTLEAAKRAGLSGKEASEAVEQVNAILARNGIKSEVKPTSAQLSRDPILLSEEGRMRGEEDFVRQFLARDNANFEAIEQAFDALAREAYEGAAEGSAGAGLKRHFASVNAKRYDQAHTKAMEGVEALEREFARIDEVSGSQVASSTRGVIEQKQQVADGYVDALYGQYRKLVGYNQKTGRSEVEIPIGKHTRLLMQKLDKESKEAILKNTSRTKSGLFNRASEGELPEGDKAALEIRRLVLGDSAVAKDVAGRVGGKDSFDIVDMQIAISELRRMIRVSDKNLSTTDLATGDLKTALKALIKDRDRALADMGRDDVFLSIKTADAVNAEVRDVLDRSMAGDIVTKTRGSYVLKNKEVFNRGFQVDGKEQADQIVAVIGDNPEAMQAWRNAILSKYKSTVYPDGKPNPKAHKEFLAKYGGTMSAYFNKEQMKNITRMGGLVGVVERQAKKLALIKARLGKKTVDETVIRDQSMTPTRTKISSLSKEEIVPWITEAGNKSPSRVMTVKSLLKSEPALWASVQRDTLQNFRDKFIKFDQMDLAALDKELLNNRATLEAMFGKTFVKDLKSVRDSLHNVSMRSKPVSGGELEEIVFQLARVTVAPPLSRSGRALSAFRKFRTKAHRDALARTFLNPEDLHELARLSRVNPNSREAAEILTTLGFYELTDTDIEDPPQ